MLPPFIVVEQPYIDSMGGNTVIDFAFRNEERKAVSNETKIITHIYYEKRHV